MKTVTIRLTENDYIMCKTAARSAKKQLAQFARNCLVDESRATIQLIMRAMREQAGDFTDPPTK